MTRAIWAGTCSAIVGAATIAVMAQTSPAQPPPAQQNSSASAEHRITVTGCLKAGPPAAADTGTAGTAGTAAGGTSSTGTTGTAGAASDPADAHFVLTNAKVSTAAADNAAAGSTAGSTAAESQASSDQPGQTYRLVANPASLSPHVGKKLELTGTLVDPSKSTSSASSEAAASANAPALRVEAGKVLAASCQD